MMNDFGVPMTDADINMSSNPAKAMLDQQLAMTGAENQIAWGAIGLGVSVVGSIIGGNKQQKAARQQAEANNEATQRQYEYDMEKWELDKESILANRDFAIKEIAAKERNEGRIADYQDAMNAQRYQRDLQIRNLEQKSNEDQYKRSEEVYTKQLYLNAASYQTAYESERRNLEEIHTEQSFDKQEALLEAMLKEGQLRARGMNGRSAAKGGQVNAADFGRQIAQLNEGFASAGRSSRAVFEELAQDKSSADLAAYSSRMLDPGLLPLPLQPLLTPRAEFIYPRELEDFDFGPQPVLGAIQSPSAAAGRVWGSTISGIAGSVGTAFSGGDGWWK